MAAQFRHGSVTYTVPEDAAAAGGTIEVETSVESAVAVDAEKVENAGNAEAARRRSAVGGSRALMAPVDDLPAAVIEATNAVGGIVGYIVGEGAVVSFSTALVNPATVCIDVDDEVTLDEANFPVADVAAYDVTLGEFVVAGRTDVTLDTDTQQVCFPTTTGGSFHPVLRITDFDSIAAPPASTSAAAQVSASVLVMLCAAMALVALL